MVDTTRPYHWGRPNENYAGPTRAAAGAATNRASAPSGDFDVPSDSPEVDLDDVTALDPTDLLEAYRNGEDPLQEYIEHRQEGYRAYLSDRFNADEDAEQTYREHADLRSLQWKLKKYAEEADQAETVDRDSELNAEAIDTASEGIHRVDNGIVIGYVAVEESFNQTEHFETAAWYQDHTVTPGVYPVVARFGYGDTRPSDVSVRYDTVKGRSNFQSLAGGVAIGEGYDNESTVGQTGTVSRQEYGYELPSADGASGFGGNVFYCPEVDIDWVERGESRFRESDVPSVDVRVRLDRDRFPA